MAAYSAVLGVTYENSHGMVQASRYTRNVFDARQRSDMWADEYYRQIGGVVNFSAFDDIGSDGERHDLDDVTIIA